MSRFDLDSFSGTLGRTDHVILTSAPSQSWLVKVTRWAPAARTLAHSCAAKSYLLSHQQSFDIS